MSLIFDSLLDRNSVGQQFDQLLHSCETKTLRLISPYISSGKWNPQQLLAETPNLEYIDILCDLENPACNPNTVRVLARNQKIKIKYMKGIHAKVYIFDTKVLVTSANFTPNGMGEGLIEAGSVSDETSDANKWYESLWNSAKDVPADNDNESWNSLIERWKIARAKSLQFVLCENEKPHILDLLSSKVNFENIAFCLWYEDTETIETEENDVVEAFPELIDIPSEKWDFFWEGDSEGRNQTDFDQVESICQTFDDKIIVNIQVNNGNNKPNKKQTFFLSKSMKKRVWGKNSGGKTEICSIYQYVDELNTFTLANKSKEKSLIQLIYDELDDASKMDCWENWVNNDLGYVSFEDMQRFLGFIE